MGNGRTAAAENPPDPPPPIAKLTDYAEMFEGGQEKSVLLGERYRDIAEREGVAFLDAGQVIRCSDLDGIHYEVDQHELLGLAVAEAVRGALAPPAVSMISRADDRRPAPTQERWR